MPVNQVGTLVTFAPGQVISSADVNANFDELKTKFNALVTGLNTLNIDTINEVTAAAGVTVDGLLIKDAGISAAGITSGILPVTRGGLGIASPTSGNLVVGAGAVAMTLLAPGAAGGYVRSSGTAWVRSGILVGDLPAHTHAAADTTSGTFADARIALSNVTQHGDGRYARVATADTITAQHTFAPSVAQAPFLLGANAQGQVVVGFNADTVDGSHAAAFAAAAHTHPAADVVSGTFANARISQANVTQHQAALSIAETQIPDGAILARVGTAETVTGLWTFSRGAAVPFAVAVGALVVANLDADKLDGSHATAFAAAAHTHAAADITSGILPVTRGGIGVASPTSGNLLVGAGAAAMTLLAPGAAGGFVRSNGTAWVRSTIIASDLPAHTHAEGDITDGTILARVASAETITGLWTFSRGAAAPFAVAATSLVVANLDADKLDGSHASAFALAAHTHAAADITSGILPVARGGLGIASPTSGNLVVGAGAAAMTLLAPGAAGGFVRSNGTAWVRSAILVGDLPAHTHAEADITDGTILARLAAGETVTGAWTFNNAARIVINDGSALTRPVALVHVSTAAPAAEDYPDGTIWIQV